MSKYAQIRDALVSLQPSSSASISGGLTDEDILSTERGLGFTLPSELKHWLKVVNGASVGTQVFLGINTPDEYFDLAKVMGSYPEWKNYSWIPVASDGCGNYYVTASPLEPCPIAFIDTMACQSSLAYLVATSLDRFLMELIHSEHFGTGWPFDRDYVLKHDPKMEQLGLAPLPWED